MTYDHPGAQPSGYGRPGGAARASAADRRRYKSSGRSKRGKNGRKQRPTWRKFLGWKAFVLYFLGAVLLFFIAVGIAYTNSEIPDVANASYESESTIVYWNDGETELGRFEAVKRIPVGYDDMPEHLRNAVVAAEDRSFYDNKGFDPVGIARAGVGFVTSGGEIEGGGSTISQQYVKNLYFTQDQTLSRKVDELFVSVKVNQELAKEDIITGYLNLIWFGGQVYGVEVAAQRLFDTSASELTLAESAALAVLIKHPPSYDPRIEGNKERFADRFQYVLDGMVSIGAIDQATADATEPPEFEEYEEESSQYAGPNGYLLAEVKRELVCTGAAESTGLEEDADSDDESEESDEAVETCDAPFTEEELYTGGYRIVTTFDRAKQKAAVEAVKEERPENDEFVHVALAAVVPGDGALVAMYGGPDAIEQGTNDATQAKKQVGSTFKAFAVAAALEQGYTLADTFDGDSPYEHAGLGTPVENQGDRDYGEVDLLTATERSVNTAFIDLMFTLGGDETQVGAEILAETAVRMGISEETTGDYESIAGAGERLTLGAAGVSAADLADGYATIAAGGRQADWYVVKSVTDRGGNVKYEGKDEIETVLEPEIAGEVSYALQQVVESENGTGKRAQEIGRPSTGKTGTHQEETAWYAGYTPQLATAVGIFREDYSGEVRTEDGQAALPLDEVDGEHMAGGSYPLSIWMAFMEAALEDEEVIEFPERPDGRPTPSPTDSPTESPTDDPTDDADEAEVPNVIGMSLNDAISTLSARGFGVGNVTGNGDVVASTNPQPGAMVREGTTVDIKVTSNEFAVPDVRGWAEADAVSHLRGLGLRVNVTYVSTDDYPGSCGIVVEQDPGPGATVRTGDNVKLNVPKDSEWGCSPGGGDEGGDGDGDEGGDEGGDGSESGGNGEGNGNGNNGN